MRRKWRKYLRRGNRAGDVEGLPMTTADTQVKVQAAMVVHLLLTTRRLLKERFNSGGQHNPPDGQHRNSSRRFLPHMWRDLLQVA